MKKKTIKKHFFCIEIGCKGDKKLKPQKGISTTPTASYDLQIRKTKSCFIQSIQPVANWSKAKMWWCTVEENFLDSVVWRMVTMADGCWTAERWRHMVLGVLLMVFVDERPEVFNISSLKFPKSSRSLETLPSIFQNLENFWIAREEKFTVRLDV